MDRIKRLLKPYSDASTAGIFRAIPVRSKGKLYVSPMPFGAYDTGNRVMSLYVRSRVGHVFILAQDAEIKAKAKRDIRKEYEKHGITYSQFPFKDMHAPDFEGLETMVALAIKKLSSCNIAIHCHAGVGRTSVGACCVVQAVDELSAKDSIDYVKGHMEVNMTAEQKSAVMRFGERLRAKQSRATS